MNQPAPQTIRLPDGRRLAYAEYGDPAGFPLFFFHGTPGSHIDWELFDVEGTTRQLGVRLIAVDRPGIGSSDFQPGRRFLDWPADVSALAHALRIERFSVLGYSSGGAYALACAYQIPGRLVKAGLLNGDGPYDQPGLIKGAELAMIKLLSLSSTAPGLFRLALRLTGWAAVHAPGLYQAIFKALLPGPDQAIFASPAVRQALDETVLEALRCGPAGAQRDMAIMVEPWDFDPAEISMPVNLWVGLEDQSTSPAMGYYLEKVIHSSAAHFVPGEGHLSLLNHHAAEILTTLIED